MKDCIEELIDTAALLYKKHLNEKQRIELREQLVKKNNAAEVSGILKSFLVSLP